ncbi:MAG: hypothetical protein ABII13_04770 [Patescibacteria group bacterium]|nr:hypothetical protein [Patescibacteria group bacterium]MBU2508903.1 hypothetical protein [Patescibacteria group bacterium]
MSEKKKKDKESSGVYIALIVIIATIVVAVYISKRESAFVKELDNATKTAKSALERTESAVDEESPMNCKEAVVAVFANPTKKSGKSWDPLDGLPDIAIKAGGTWYSTCKDKNYCTRTVAVEGDKVWIEVYDNDGDPRFNKPDFMGKGYIEIVSKSTLDEWRRNADPDGTIRELTDIGDSRAVAVCKEYE